MKGMYAIVALIVLLGSAFAVCSDDADAAEGKTHYVKFVTDKNGSNSGDGSPGNPFQIVISGNEDDNSNVYDLPSGVNDGDTLFALSVEDVAETRNGSDVAPHGYYNINKNVTIDGSKLLNPERWNASLHLTGSASKLIIQNFLFGELYVDGRDNSRNVTIQKCDFIIDSDSVNYTENFAIPEQYHNVRGNYIDITVTGCNFECKGLPTSGTKSYAVYPLQETTKLTVYSCTIDGYNSAINADLKGEASITNNTFTNITNRAGTESGFAVQIAGENTEIVSISGNTATSATPVENGDGNTFLSVHNGFKSEKKVPLEDNQMFGFGYGIKYKVNGDKISDASIVADKNLFSKDGETATEMEVSGGEGKVVQKNPIMEIPSEEPEEPTTPSNPGFDDEDDEFPFIPGQNQPSGKDDTTTYIAVAAAAAVVAVLAVLVMAMSKGKL